MKTAIQFAQQIVKVLKDKNFELAEIMMEDLIEKIQDIEEKYSHISDEDAEYLEDHCLDSMKETYDKWCNEELIEKSDDDAKRLEVVRDLKLSYERLSIGVASEIDTIIQLTNELIELHD